MFKSEVLRNNLQDIFLAGVFIAIALTLLAFLVGWLFFGGDFDPGDSFMTKHKMHEWQVINGNDTTYVYTIPLDAE